MAKFNVVAFETKRYELTIEANNEQEAEVIADDFNVEDWNEDYEYYEFVIDNVSKANE